MIVALLVVALLAVIALLVVYRRYTSFLSSVACLIGAILALILLQDSGWWPMPPVPPTPAPPGPVR